MADTRNEIYPAGEGAASQPCESKQDSPHKIVVMKVNAGEPCGKEEENNEKVPDKLCSPASRTFPPKSDNPILASSRFGSNFGSKPFSLRQSAFGSSRFGNGSPTSSCLTSSPKQVVLRPSQLAVSCSDSSSTDVSTPRTNNPFARVPNLSEDCQENTQSKKPDVQNKPEEDKKSDTAAESTESKPVVEENILGQKTAASSPAKPLLTTPKFVPLGTPVTQKDETSSSGSASKPTASVTGFVFGQNLHERVEVAKSTGPETSTNSTVETTSSSPSGSGAATNGTSEMLFSSVIRKELATEGSSSSSSSCGASENTERPSKSLSEAAREYEEARAIKRKYEEVTVVTGEEDEANVLQLNCKLFAFDKDTWVERGRGNLRLNDKDGPDGMQSRVVIRTTGSLRVVLNTKIWAGMVVDRASAKSIRLTAMDNTGQVKVFLVMASPKEIEQLHHALLVRVTSKQKQLANESKREGSSGGESATATSDAAPEPTSKRPSLLPDAGGGEDSDI